MIFRNNRQWLPIESYHILNGSRTTKINVSNELTTSEFKHPFYTHDKHYWDAQTLDIMINGDYNRDPYNKAFNGITVIPGRSNRHVIATATIRSKTDVPNYIDQAILRDSVYTHDLEHLRISSKPNTIFITNADSDGVRFGLPPGADTDIYTDEEASGGVTFKQTWVG